MVTYGLCKHHVTNARIMVKTGQLNRDATMRLLKAVYEGRWTVRQPNGRFMRNLANVWDIATLGSKL